MSIIQEALKKAQSDHVKADEPAAPKNEDVALAPTFTKRAPHIEVALQSRAKSIPLALLIMLAFAAVVFTANHFFVLQTGVGLQNGSDVVGKAVPAYRQEVAYKGPEKKSDTLGAGTGLGDVVKSLPISNIKSDDTPLFLLNGIMYLETGPKAIIDGSVVEEGDVIRGATVKAINKNNVILDYKDREISLNLKD